MRKYMKLALLCVMFIMLGACSSEPTPTATPVPTAEATAEVENIDFEALRDEHAEMLVNGDFNAFLEQGSVGLQEALADDILKNTWEQSVQYLGAFSSYGEVTLTDSEGSVTATVELMYENAAMLLTLNYDAQGVVQGVFIAPIATGLEQTEAFTETEIAVGEYGLKGVLTVPRDVEGYPVVVLVQGSGATDYNETIGAAQNTPFKDLAHGLAERGIASVRYNKRNYEHPELFTDEDTLSIYDEAIDDALWAITWASENVSEEVYLIGHSLGGMIAPKISELSGELSGFVMLAGTTRALTDVVYDQNMNFIEYMDMSDLERAAALAYVETEYEKFLNGESAFGMPQSYADSLATLNGMEILQSTELPVLIMQGEKDFQIYYEQDYLMMQAALSERANIEFISYAELNHLFMPQVLEGEAIDLTEYDTPNSIPDYVIDDLANFLLK